MGLAERVLGMSCAACKAMPSLKEVWGCEKPAEMPFATMTCVRCEGDACSRCKGSGQEDLRDCPVRLLRATPQAHDAIGYYRWFNQHNVLPRGGGLLDQTAAFVKVVSVIDDELASIQRERERRRR